MWQHNQRSALHTPTQGHQVSLAEQLKNIHSLFSQPFCQFFIERCRLQT
jgi:hypothetical protein